MSREWRLYVADMREFCARIAEYTDGLSREEFEKTRLVYDATLRNLELIGEAARNVPDESSRYRWLSLVLSFCALPCPNGAPTMYELGDRTMREWT